MLARASRQSDEAMLLAQSPDAGLSTILAAAVGAIAALAVAAINAVYTSFRERREYQNEYYKTVVTKRLDAYEALEILIIALKTSIVDSDRQAYHALFSEGDYERPHNFVTNVMNRALWLSDDAFRKVQELNRLFFDVQPSRGSTILFAKKNYNRIATIRSELEDILADDMATLYDVRGFFARRRRTATSGVGPIRLGADATSETK